jgi:hypothetical protein
MKLLATLVSVVLMLGGASPATGQRQDIAGSNDMGFFHTPVFLAQPGLVMPFSTDATTEFNARVVTAIPLSLKRTTLVAIVQFTPFAENAAGGKANAPGFVYGPVVNLFNERLWSFDIDGLFAYGPAATGNSDYTHKFLFEGDVYFKLGNAMNAKSQWNGLSLYAFLAYVVSGLPSGVESKDRMVLLAGLSLPLAPWKKQVSP